MQQFLRPESCAVPESRRSDKNTSLPTWARRSIHSTFPEWLPDDRSTCSFHVLNKESLLPPRFPTHFQTNICISFFPGEKHLTATACHQPADFNNAKATPADPATTKHLNTSKQRFTRPAWSCHQKRKWKVSTTKDTSWAAHLWLSLMCFHNNLWSINPHLIILFSGAFVKCISEKHSARNGVAQTQSDAAFLSFFSWRLLQSLKLRLGKATYFFTDKHFSKLVCIDCLYRQGAATFSIRNSLRQWLRPTLSLVILLDKSNDGHSESFCSISSYKTGRK